MAWMKLTKIYMGKGRSETELSVPESIAPAVLTVIRGGPRFLYWVASLLFLASSGLFILAQLKISEPKLEIQKIEPLIECRLPSKMCGTAVEGGNK